MGSAETLMERVLFKFAKQWIAGNTINDALIAAREAYKNGRHAIINKLGEYHTTKKQIRSALRDYQKIMDSFESWRVKGGVSIKPTQIGLSLSKKECLRNLQDIVNSARRSHTFVWLDMESSEHTDATFEIYFDLFSRYERVGVAIQANLKRSYDDLVDLTHHGAKIRLVKGAYKEDERISFKKKNDVDENYLKLMRFLFKNGNEFGIATHDKNLIDKAVRLSKRYERNFEFQMLKGIRDELKPELIKRKIIVADYIPYGTGWLPYSIRRIRERKRNILLLGSSFIQSHRV